MKWLLRDNSEHHHAEGERLAAQFGAFREHALAQVNDDAPEYKTEMQHFLLGEPGEFDTLPGAREMHEALDKLHLSANATNYLLQPYNPLLAKMFRSMLYENDLRRQVLELPIGTFEKVLYKEHMKRAWQLDKLNEQLHALRDDTGAFAYKNIDMHRLFDDTAIAQGRVFTSNPVVVPYFLDGWATGGTDDEMDSPWAIQPFSSDEDTKMCGYDYQMALITRSTKDKAGKRKMVLMPAICIAPPVFRELQHCIDSKDERLSRAAVDLMHELRGQFTPTIHDHIHNAVWADKSHLDRHPKRNMMSGYAGQDMPAFRGGKEHEALDRFHRVAVPGTVTAVERHGELINTFNWKLIFEDERGQAIKGDIVRQAVSFLDHLNDFKKAAGQRLGGDDDAHREAENMAIYLAVMVLSRFHRNILFNDPMLHTEFRLQNKKTLSFAQAAEALKFPAYEVKADRIKEQKYAHPKGDVRTNALKGANIEYLEALLGITGDQDWRDGPKPRQFDGLRGLEARVICEAPPTCGWVHDFTPWHDKHTPVAKMTQLYDDAMRAPELQERPGFKDAKRQYGKYVHARAEAPAEKYKTNPRKGTAHHRIYAPESGDPTRGH